MIRYRPAVIALAFGFSSIALPANAVPVIDNSVLSKTSVIASNTADILAELTEIKNLTEETLEAIGPEGTQSMDDMFSADDWQPFADALFLDEIAGTAPNECEFLVCTNQTSQSGDTFEAVDTARMFVEDTFYLPPNPTQEDYFALKRTRERAVRSTSLNAYATALLSRQYSAGLQERSQKLVNIVESADTLREEMRANTAVLLALHQQLGQMQATIATTAEMQAASAVADDLLKTDPDAGQQAQAPQQAQAQ